MDVRERPDRINSERSSDFGKKGRKKLRMTIWFSKENYEFLKENYDGRISEIMDAFATFLRTENVVEVSVLRIGMPGAGFEPATMRSSAARSPWLSYPDITI